MPTLDLNSLFAGPSLLHSEVVDQMLDALEKDGKYSKRIDTLEAAERFAKEAIQRLKKDFPKWKVLKDNEQGYCHISCQGKLTTGKKVVTVRVFRKDSGKSTLTALVQGK